MSVYEWIVYYFKLQLLMLIKHWDSNFVFTIRKKRRMKYLHSVKNGFRTITNQNVFDMY